MSKNYPKQFNVVWRVEDHELVRDCAKFEGYPSTSSFIRKTVLDYVRRRAKALTKPDKRE